MGSNVHGAVPAAQHGSHLLASLPSRDAETVRRDLERAIPNLVVTIHADPWPELPEDAESKG